MWKEKGGETLMKHVKSLSKPASAEQTAWVELKNIFNIFGARRGFIDPVAQGGWIGEQWYNYLVK
jgi:hypothetical protein